MIQTGRKKFRVSWEEIFQVKAKTGLFEKERYRWLYLASGYQIIRNTLVKHGFIEKIGHNVFRSIFGTGYSTVISLHVGAFKKDIQQNSSIELTFISR